MSDLLLRLGILGLLMAAPIFAWETYGELAGIASKGNPAGVEDHQRYLEVAQSPVYEQWHDVVYFGQPRAPRRAGLHQIAFVLLLAGAVTRRKRGAPKTR